MITIKNYQILCLYTCQLFVPLTAHIEVMDPDHQGENNITERLKEGFVN